MPHNDLHLTTEQISELIDDRLTPEAHAHAEEHLRRCAQCQEEFTNLHQVVTMLHALPSPELPRSFTLPASTKVIPLATATANRSSRFRSAGRAISLLAAVVGIALLISSLFGSLTREAPTAGSSAASAPNPQTIAPHNTPPFTSPTRTGTSAATATAAPSQHIPPSQPAQPLPTPSPSLLDLLSSSGQAIFGIALLVIGLIGTLILWRRRYSKP